MPVDHTHWSLLTNFKRKNRKSLFGVGFQGVGFKELDFKLWQQKLGGEKQEKQKFQYCLFRPSPPYFRCLLRRIPSHLQ
jgi:hypothetical protein